MADSAVTITGNLTSDPEVRYTTGGMAAVNLRVAVNKRRKVKDEWEEKTSYVNVTAFGSLGENVAASCVKGTRVVVHGEFDQREWEDDQGTKHTVLGLLADEVAPSLRFATAVVEKNPRREQ